MATTFLKRATTAVPFAAGIGLGIGFNICNTSGFNSSSLVDLPFQFLLKRLPAIAASPTFEGIPVAATLLIHQAYPRFSKAFPGLELSPAFSPGKDGHFYKEEGGLFGIYPTSCKVGIPIYERLSQLEESRIGQALLMKPVVAILILTGECSVGCASASLSRMELFKVDEAKNPRSDALVWMWEESSTASRSN